MNLDTIMRKATIAHNGAAQAQLTKLQDQGPAWAVCDQNQNGRVVGTMLDVCGSAYLSFDGNSKLARGLKKAWGLKSLKDRQNGRSCIDVGDWFVGGEWPTGFSIVWRCYRQEISVQLAGAKAALEVLAQYGYADGVRARSRVD